MRTTPLHRFMDTCALTVLVAAVPGLAQAVDNATTPSVATSPSGTAGASPVGSEQIEDIVVTAQKRSENSQNVPISISTVTAAGLAKTGVTDLVSIRTAVPSLNLTNTNGRLSLSLRGIGTTAVGPGIENPIALYIDGVYLGAPASSLLSLNQIERIEVLKGPQGTLFGRNATGGLVQVITRDPTNTPTFSGNLSYANYNDVTATAYAGGEIIEGLDADIAAYFRRRDGWGTNAFDGKSIYGIGHDLALRSKWIFKPWQGGRITLIGDYSNTLDTTLPLPPLPGSISPFAAGIQPDIGYDANLNDFRDHKVRAGGVSIKLEQELGNTQLTTITAYRKSRTAIGGDLDGGPQKIEYYDTVQHDQQFSQEVQLSSRGSGKFKWTTGAFYYNARSDTPALIALGDAGITVNLGKEALRTKSVAGYGQASYEIFSDTNLTVGGRYTHEIQKTEDAEIKVTPFDATPEQFPFIPLPDAKITANKATYRVSLDHRFSDAVLAYASINRGFKSGGFNITAPGSAPFRPETLDAYEVGVKTDLLDRHLRLNIAGFYYDYKDIQTLKLLAGGVATINGGTAKDYGVDADLTAILTEGLRLTVGGTLLSAKFGTFVGCPTGTPRGGVPITAGDCTNHQLPLAAKFSSNAALDYTVELHDGAKVDFNGNVYHNSGYSTEIDNIIRQASFTEFGASARWTAPSGKLYAGVFGRNLSNERVLTFAATQSTGLQQATYAEPHSYGVNAGFNF